MSVLKIHCFLLVNRKFQEIATGKAGCVPAEDLGFVTIHYFAGRGRAEAIRLLLEQANVPYNQTDFTRESWPEAKKAGVEKGLYTYGQGDTCPHRPTPMEHLCINGRKAFDNI